MDKTEILVPVWKMSEWNGMKDNLPYQFHTKISLIAFTEKYIRIVITLVKICGSVLQVIICRLINRVIRSRLVNIAQSIASSDPGAYLGGVIVPWLPRLGRQDCKIA